MRHAFLSTAFGLSMIVLAAMPAAAEDTLKIAYVDPLSGGGASIGQIGLDQMHFIADEANAKGGVLGKQVEIVPFDNQLDPQKTLVQVQKAIDQGIRIIVQGNGSSVGSALEGFVAKYNSRNPGHEVIYLNYAAIDPALTNANCSYWHFAFDANVTIKMNAIVNVIGQDKDITKVYLIDQDYSFGHAVADAAVAMLKEKRPDIQIVGNEFHPLVKVQDFSPYVAKIKASGAQAVITGNWGQDFALLIKAAGDAGLNVKWYTFYAGGAGGPTAIKQANLPDQVYAVVEGINNYPNDAMHKVVEAYNAKHPGETYYGRMFNMTGMLFKAIDDTKSDDPVKIAADLEGMTYPTFTTGKDGFMRKDDHQFFQPLFVSDFGPLSADEKFDEEKTGWGWKPGVLLSTQDTVVPTSCKMERP